MPLTPEEIEERLIVLEEGLKRRLRSSRAFTTNPLALATDLDDLGSVKTHLDFEEAPLTPVDPPEDVLRVSAVDVSGVTGLRLTDSASTDTTIVARTRTLNISLGAFTVHTGSPLHTQVANTSVWAFDDTVAQESITAAIVVPEDYVSGDTVRLHYYMASATSGAVSWNVYGYSREEGENYANPGTAFTVNDTVQGTAANLGIVDFSLSTIAISAGDNLRIRVRRSGANGSDTAAGDAYLVGVAFVYTAFF